MRRFDLRSDLETGFPGSIDLGEFLQTFLEKRLDRRVSGEECRRLITQGSLWSGFRRLKDPGLPVKSLLEEDGDLQLFYPELPIQDFRFDPADLFYEDQDLVLVHKRAGVNTCPSVFSDTDCLSAGLQQFLDEREQERGRPVPHYRLNTVNRLDRATSGLVFFAKHPQAEAALHALFRDRRIRKRYLAATPAFDEPRNCYKIRDQLEAKGKLKPASTLVVRTETPPGNKDSTLFYWWALPQTGRTHQIRIHFQRYLTPIVGDAAYGQGLYKPEQTLHLVCVGYRFRHPFTGQYLTLESWKGFG